LKRGQRIFVAGHRGLVGSAIVRCLEAKGYDNILVVPRSELELREQSAVERWFSSERPDVVFLAAAKVGGILANNTYPADFIRDNLQVQTNTIESAWRSGTKQLLFLGSSCIYPRAVAQPMREDALMTGPLEPTNEAYAVAKIAGVAMCDAYRKQHGVNFVSVMPTNLYGAGDNFDLESSHVLPALLRKCHEAKSGAQEAVTLWGSGKPRREFLHVDDLASACVLLMERDHQEGLTNVGCGEDISIEDLARLIAGVVGFEGRFVFDRSKPDGTPRKLLDVSKLRALGWSPTISLRDGIESTYRWYLDRHQA